MIDSALDTTLEARLRAVIFLFLLNRPVDADYLGALDTLTINAHTFGLGPDNLNGPHRLASAELQARTSLMARSLTQLTFQGLTTYESAPASGFCLTEQGERVVNKLRTGYANQLFDTTLEVLEQIGDATTTELTTRILSAASPEGAA